MRNATFSKKVCIVTGAASGLGHELGKQLAASGASVVLGDIDEAHLQEVAAEITQAGGKARAIQVDVTEAGSVQALIEGAAAEFRRIDYLFNNAGVAIGGEIRDLSLEAWRRVIEINLFGVIHGVHFAYPFMIRQGSGHIVNTSSIFGMAPVPLNSPYVASKFAVFGISHSLAAEARAFGIDVSVVCPGYLHTAMIDHMNSVDADTKDVVAQIPVELLPPEKAAQIVLAGVARKQMLIAFPAYVHRLAFLHRSRPGVFMRMVLAQVDHFRKIERPDAGTPPSPCRTARRM
jgi:NAD(P)-dependent dehydrogenase (short-subunit alcohol dehydrogenase family)